MAEPDAELMAAAARLYYVDDLGQHEVAAILGVSRSTVSRLLSAARARGIVRIEVLPYRPRHDELERRLRERFGLRLAVVVRANDRGVAAVRRAIGHFGARDVAALIRDGMAIGVAGGRTLGELVGALARTAEDRDVVVAQLMGHVDQTARQADAAEIGRTLAAGYGGVFLGLNAPAFVRDRRTRDSLLEHDHIRRVFQRIERLDLALVGIGALEDSLLGERGMVTAAEFAHLRRLGAVGDLCGRFFDRAGREIASPFRERVIGVELDVLRRLFVVGVTHGAARTEATLAALRGGLVDALVLDEEGAAGLLDGG